MAYFDITILLRWSSGMRNNAHLGSMDGRHGPLVIQNFKTQFYFSKICPNYVAVYMFPEV